MSRYNSSPRKGTETKSNVFLILRFTTFTGYKIDSVEIPLNFDDNLNYLPRDEGYTNLESGVLFHLIKRASDRLALNTTNDNLQNYKTELTSIMGGEVNNGRVSNIKEVIPLEEIRQYTSAQKVKAVLKAGVAGLGATVTGTLDVLGAVAPIFLGAEVGSNVGGNIAGNTGAVLGAYEGANIGSKYSSNTNVSGLTRDVFQGILGDEYLEENNKKLFLNRKTYTSEDGKYIEADVPFSITIADLVFPRSLITGETYTLYIEGIFLGVHVGSTRYEVTHGDASNIQIKDAKLLLNSKNKKQIKKILQDCKNNSECMYFESEI